MPKPRGFILYEGPSVLNEVPIVAIATLNTTNRKTGPMIQTWILNKDTAPLEASKTGEDAAVCGICPLRHHNNGSCYVVIAHAPRGVWNAFQAGTYEQFSETLHSGHFEGRSIRLGAYGDPAAVPYEVWARIVALTASHTGYTHQAAHRNFDRRITLVCMVSADTPAQATKVQRQGHSTFRVRRTGEPLQRGELECMSERGLTCEECLLCSGNGSANIAINAHGSFLRRPIQISA